MKPNPFIDILATIMVMLTLGTLGYWWLTSEADKILDKSNQQKAQPEQKHEKSVMERYAPKSFAAVVKRTEME